MQFRQVFFGLMMLSLLSSFGLPRRVSQVNGSALQTLLIPLSRPAYRLANLIRGRVQPRESEPASVADAHELLQENEALKQQIQRMSAEIAELERRAGERASLGGFEALCDRFEVVAADSELRDEITITGSGIGKVATDDPVLSSGGTISLIGRVSRVGELSAQVRLVTDPGFAVTAHFVSYSAAGAQENKQLEPIVAGRGNGRISIENLPLADVARANLHAGDWVVLSDETWPENLQGIPIARIESIEPLARQTLFADIHLAPEPYLQHLNDVWVMTHHQG